MQTKIEQNNDNISTTSNEESRTTQEKSLIFCDLREFFRFSMKIEREFRRKSQINFLEQIKWMTNEERKKEEYSGHVIVNFQFQNSFRQSG